MGALTSFCRANVNTCILGCGSVRQDSKNCVNGITAWAPPQGTEPGEDFLTPHQTYDCSNPTTIFPFLERKLYQTTSYEETEDKKLVLAAHIIVTYLSPKKNHVEIYKKKLE